MKRFLLLFALSILCISPAMRGSTLQNEAQCGTRNKTLVSGFPSWTADARVKVFIVAADFKADEIAAMLVPLDKWNKISGTSGSHVTFFYSGAVTAPQDCLNCLTIMRGHVYSKNKNHAAELQAMANMEERTLISAHIVIDPIVPNLTALTNAVAHELGHMFGLNDCLSCARNSIMGGIRSSNALDGPTACDLIQVGYVYEDLRIRLAALKKKRAEQLAVRIIPVDEGEEPIDDDTPVTAKRP